MSPTRRVLLLETDERAGLVAGLAATCASRAVSLEITTGPGHVLLTCAADQPTLEALVPALLAVPGVVSLRPYTVA